MDPQTPITPIENTVPNQILDSSNKIPTDNHRITILSMALFVLLALGAVVFLYYQNQQLKGIVASYQVKTTMTPSPIIYPTITPEASTSASPKPTVTPTPSSLLTPSSPTPLY